MRDVIADYQLIRSRNGPGPRHLARPPDRLHLDGPVLVSELAVDAEGWQGLCDRLARLATVPGDALLRLIEVGPDLDTGTVFVVTEEAELPGAPNDAADAVDRVVQAAKALHAMHEVGLTYGPLNVDSLLSAEGRTVLDLPRIDGPAGEMIERSDWQVLQTFEPEVLGGEAATRGSDIWSLGAVLHCLLSSRPLYPGIEEDETVTAVQRVLFTRPTPDPAIDERCLSLIEACLQPDPDDRPGSALEIATRLESVGAP